MFSHQPAKQGTQVKQTQKRQQMAPAILCVDEVMLAYLHRMATAEVVQCC